MTELNSFSEASHKFGSIAFNLSARSRTWEADSSPLM